MIVSKTPKRWLRRNLAGALLPLMAVCGAHAETYIQSVNQNGSGDWNTLAHWNTNGDNTPAGTSPTSINSSDDFVASRNGWSLRTPTGNSTFGGGSLTLGGTHVLAVRSANSSSMTTVPNLYTRGTPYLRASYGISNLTVEYLQVESGTLEIDGHTSTTPKFGVTVNILDGVGDIKTTSTPSGTNRLSFLDATSYQGTITVESGKVQFMTEVSSAGAFVAPVPADVTFDHDAVFTGLTVNDTSYSPGTYSLASLGFGGSGNITVRTSNTWYLSTNQSGAQDWTQAYASNWTANANGTGGAAPSINIIDTYVHNVGSNALRTPADSSVFLGGSLDLGGSAQLVLNGGSSAISTVPALITSGGTIVVGGGTRNLSVDQLAATSGSATFSTTSGGVLNLFVGDLVGEGNFTISGAGTFSPFIDHANHYTGTITVNNGATLHVLTKFCIGGGLVVNPGGNVILDDYTYVTALTVAGVAKPVGTYTASNLGSGFTGSGSIVVHTPDLDGPPQMFGVNLAGAEFKNQAYWQDIPAVWDYFQAKGLTLIRLPIKWHRIQSQLYGSVNFTKMDACIALANARGMKVILDLHNYSEYATGEDAPKLGSPELPIDTLADVWTKIAEHYKDEPAIYAYDLMNEPSGPLEVWAEAAQLTVDAIRKVDQNNYVMIEGMAYSNAQKWPLLSGSLDIMDPVGRLIYSAHSYWDTLQGGVSNNWASDGTYLNNEPRASDIGVEHARPFVEWLQTRPYAHGNFGEYGIPVNYNTADWNIALGNFLAYLGDNNISGTYWAAGAHWNNYQLSCHPISIADGIDAPQMHVLEAYNNIAAPAEVIVDNVDAVITGSWSTSTSYPGYYGDDYRHDGNGGKGSKTMQFIPELGDGSYEVFLRWTSDNNRSGAVPVTVVHAGGTDLVYVNQKVNGGMWVSIGTFPFAEGTGGSVTISNAGTSGYVIGDAAMFTPADPVEVIVNNLDAVVTGSWTASTGYQGYHGDNYLHDGNGGKGTKTVQFIPDLEVGHYQVFMRWTSDSNRSDEVPVTIVYDGGTHTFEVNQKIGGGVWVPVGSYDFAEGTGGSLTIGTAGTSGYVIADAVAFVR